MKYLRNSAILFLFTIVGCAALDVLPSLKNRRLWISRDSSGLFYKYCVDRTFWRKKCKKWKVDFYDFNKKEVRQKLIDTGFTCTSDRRFK